MYALYDFLSTQRYKWVTTESMVGLGFLTNILTLSGLVKIFEMPKFQVHFSVYIGGLLVLFLLIQYLTTYFGGIRYRIPRPDSVDLVPILNNVLRRQGDQAPNQVAENDDYRFEYPGEKNYVELSPRQGSFNRQNYYYLKFIKWRNHGLRASILDDLDASLEKYEFTPPSALYKTLELIVILVIIVGAITFFNYQSMLSEEVAIYDANSIPQALVLEDYDLIVENAELLERFQSEYENTHARYAKNVSPSLIQSSDIRVSYGVPHKTLLVGPNITYLYIDFDALKDFSKWDNLMVQIYSLYGNRQGAFYRIPTIPLFYEELSDLIQVH